MKAFTTLFALLDMTAVVATIVRRDWRFAVFAVMFFLLTAACTGEAEKDKKREER